MSTLPANPSPAKPNPDTLQSMLNLVLIHSGRFIKEHHAGGGTGRHKANLRQVVPIATERFQDALDELENEVRLAQTVLRRDLALLKQDRKKREIAAREKEAEKEKARVSRTLGNATTTKTEEGGVDKVSTPAAPEADEQAPSLQRADEKLPPPIETSNPPLTERDPLFDGTPTTANPQENDFDFDAMFGDAMDTGGDNNDTHGDMMDTSGDMGFDFGDGEGDGDGQSLLRGLEDFAKSGDEDGPDRNGSNGDVDMDVAMSGLPELNTATEAPVPAPTSAPAPPKPAEIPESHPPAASSEKDTTTSNNDAPKDTTTTAPDDVIPHMPTDNLDDLFNMEDYENPENSSFDDAFFNFDQ